MYKSAVGHAWLRSASHKHCSGVIVRVGYVADLGCKQQVFSEDLGHCIHACLWLCGGEEDHWINPEFPRLSLSWGQLSGTRTKPRSCTSLWSLPSAHVLCTVTVNITRLQHKQNLFKVISSCLECIMIKLQHFIEILKC